MTPQPHATLIAGPNGAGKTTFAREYLPGEADGVRGRSGFAYLNADLIAAGLSPFDPDRAALRAGRLLISLVDEAVARRESFTVETTLSGQGYARSVPQWRASGYFVTLIFLSLPDVDAAIARVAPPAPGAGAARSSGWSRHPRPDNPPPVRSWTAQLRDGLQAARR